MIQREHCGAIQSSGPPEIKLEVQRRAGDLMNVSSLSPNSIIWGTRSVGDNDIHVHFVQYTSRASSHLNNLRPRRRQIRGAHGAKCTLGAGQRSKSEIPAQKRARSPRNVGDFCG